MVIGNGLVAKAFELYKNEDDFVIFASGVSNSSEKKPNHLNVKKSFCLIPLQNIQPHGLFTSALVVSMIRR